MDNSSYDNIKKIINTSITNMMNELDENDFKYNVTILKNIINESISEYKTGNVSDLSKITSMFSGRGRAWAKVEVSDDNIVWFKIKETLLHNALNDITSQTSKECSNLLDLFQTTGISWMRFKSVSKNKVKFNLRIKGSKLENSIDVIVDSCDIFNGNIENLEGVPHKLNLEEGIFNLDMQKKKIVHKEVNSEELKKLGIQTLEDILSQED